MVLVPSGGVGMDAGVWEQEFAQARRQLVASSDFLSLRSHGHELKNGVVLTAISDVPFEVSLKCIYCAKVFWFENTEWSTGGMAKWRISSNSMKDVSSISPALVMICQSRR
jgi:hypothetical protein